VSLALATKPQMRSPSEPERCQRMIAVDLDADALESIPCKAFDQSLVERVGCWQETDLGKFGH
jgi:hypothetical protein